MRWTAWLAAGLLVWTGCASGPRGTVALLTDYGTRDHYAGVLAANVLRTNPDAQLVTITHEIEPFNITQGAFVLAEAVPEFPPGTVVLAIVDPGVGTARAPIVVETRSGHILVGPDNGLLDPVISKLDGARGVYRIENEALTRPGAASSTFHGRDLFAPVAGHLSRGVRPERVGPKLEQWVKLDLPAPTRSEKSLAGVVVHIDRYGNVLTNLPATWLDDVPLGAWFEIAAGARRVPATFQRTYGDVRRGDFVVLENASGHVEIARNLANAAEWLRARPGDTLALERVERGPP